MCCVLPSKQCPAETAEAGSRKSSVDSNRRCFVMNKEDDEQPKRREREEQRQGAEAETALHASPRAQALAERVAAYRTSLHTDLRLVYPHLLDMSRPLGAMESYIPLRVHLDSRPGYELDWELQQTMPHP